MKNLYLQLFISLLIIAGNAAAQNLPGKGDMIYGVNLVQNPGAETDNVKNQIVGWKPVPEADRWDHMNDVYGHTGGEWEFDCDEKCGLPPLAGQSYFRLPVSNENPVLSLYQEIDLSFIADTIKKRIITFTLSGFMAGFKCEQAGCASGILAITFYDKARQELVMYKLEKDNEGMQSASADQRMRKFENPIIYKEVPQGSQKVKITMQANSKQCCNHAYIFFDNINLFLSKGDYR